MSNFQNYHGCVFIDRAGSGHRLENTSFVVPAATGVMSGEIIFMVTALETGTAVHHLFRAGASTTNSPTIGIRHTPTTNTITARLNTSAQTLIGTFAIALDTPYNLIWVWNNAELNTTDHPDAASGDYAICYLYDLSTRTPTASFSKSSAAALANQLAGGSETTGIRWDSQSSRSNWAFSDTAIWWGTALTKAQANQLGQRVRDPRQIGTTPSHFWKTRYRIGTAGSDTTISASPAGSELHHLADLGSGTTYNLTANGGAGQRPAWRATSLRQAIASTEDTRLNTTNYNAVPDDYNLSLIKTAIAQGAAGTIVGLWHDSFGRPNLVARDGGHEAAAWVSLGYNVIGTTSYLNSGLAGGSSLRTGAALVAGTSGISPIGFLANGANAGEEGGGNYSTLPGTGATRFGLPIGGLAEIIFNGSPTLGANDSVMSFRIRSTCGDSGSGSAQEWFSTSDKIGFLPVLYHTDNATDRFTGTLRFVTNTGSTDWDLSGSNARTNIRLASDKAAAWSAVAAGTGAALVENTLNAYKDYIVCGTGSSSYDIEVRIPAGTIANKRFYLTVIAFKLDANNKPITGTNCVFVCHLGDDSLDLNSDLTTPGVPTNRGQKTFTTEQLADFYGIISTSRQTNVAQWLDVATENATEANTLTRVRQWLGTADATTPRLFYALKTMLGNTGTLVPAYIDQFTHKIQNTNTRPEVDGSRMTDVAKAYYTAAANGDSGSVVDGAFFSYGRRTGRLWAFPVASETNFTEMGSTEADEAAANSAMMTLLGISDGIITNADRLHLGSGPVAKGLAYARISAIDAAAVIVTPTGGGSGATTPLGDMTMAMV